MTESQKDDCVSRYQAGESCKDIARDLGFNPSSVLRLLNKRKVRIRGQLSPTQSEIDRFVEMYDEGFSSKVIAKETGWSHTSVRRHLRESGIVIRDRYECQILYHNKHSFDILTPDVKYWTGFLLADGCVHKNRICLRLARKDRNHIEKFREFVKSECSIYDGICKAGYKPGSEYSRFAFCSNRISERLKYLGVVENKTMVAQVSDLLENCPHFWRGVIDGDGCVSLRENGYSTIQLWGNKFVCHSFSNFLNSQLGIQVSEKPSKSIFYCSVGKKQEVRRVARLLYSCSDCTTFLDRKYTVAQKILS